MGLAKALAHRFATGALFFPANYRAENAVRLVASEETISVLSQLTEYIREYETQGKLHSFEEYAVAHTAALLAMRNDLMHYPIPTPESRQKESRIE